MQYLKLPLIKFVLLFCLLYFGTMGIIGLSAPGGMYSGVVAQHFNYVDGIKILLIEAAQYLLASFNFYSKAFPNFVLSVPGGRGIEVAMSCVGIGVYSFWLAYVFANVAPVWVKCLWGFVGLLLLFIINVIRIALYLWAINTQRAMPFGYDHHTWFNIAAYACIFIMIFFFEKRTSRFSL